MARPGVLSRLSLLLLVAAAPGGSDGELTLEAVMARADRDTRDMVRARADLLLVDVEKARAIANVLPSLSLYLVGNEVFLESMRVEARNYRYEELGCQKTETDLCNTIRPGGEYRLVYGPFYDARADSVSHPQFYGGLSARQVIYDGGRWWAQLARVGDIREQQQSVLASVSASVRLNALRRFFDFARSKEGVKVAELQVGLAEAQLRRTRALLDGGNGHQNDVASAERNLAVDRVTLARRLFAASAARRSLNLSMGQEPESPVSVVLPRRVLTATASVDTVHLPGRDQLLGMALEHRPEVRQARALIRIVERNIDIRAADYYPTLAFVLGYSRPISRRLDWVLGDPTENFVATMGLDLRWNVFSGGLTKAAVEEAEVELTKARANLDEVERTVKNEALEKSEELMLLIEVQRLSIDGARSAKAANDGVQSSYREGKASALELRDAEQKLIQAMLDAIVGGMNIEVARAELSRAVGLDLDDPPRIFADLEALPGP
ncbi:MAG: TolC family protein [Deltaproteobacteria bacterium]|nr:TolC family protein [Deltaproteobacteria bacterium]